LIAKTKQLILVMISVVLSGCLSIPDGVEPVSNFDVNRYLGKWYEIARLDHSFERGLERVTAEYSRRGDGGIKVINRGYSVAKDEWKQSEGKAYFVDAEDRGFLKVSFFGPFYGSYVVFELAEDYSHAFIAGPDLSYLWLLARTPEVSKEVMDQFKAISSELGFDVESLIWVNHGE